MLDRYDDDPVGALTEALVAVLDQPGRSFTDLVEIARFPLARRTALLGHDVTALDALLAELNELRTLGDADGHP